MATRPSSVTTAENRVPSRTWPEPHDPDVAGSAVRSVASWRAVASVPAPLPEVLPDVAPAGMRVTSTVLQPEPTTRVAPAALAAAAACCLDGAGLVPGAPFGVAWSDCVTVVPAGGVKANCRASGVEKSTAVKPTSKAGLDSFVE